MTHFKSEEEFQLFLLRNQAFNDLTKHIHEADPGPESKLKSKIRSHAKDQGWQILVFPESREVIRFLPPGWPDITIKLPFGHTLDIETKSYSGKLRKKQKENQLIWMHLGHTIHEVRSFKRFLQIVEGILRRE